MHGVSVEVGHDAPALLCRLGYPNADHLNLRRDVQANGCDIDFGNRVELREIADKLAGVDKLSLKDLESVAAARYAPMPFSLQPSDVPSHSKERKHVPTMKTLIGEAPVRGQAPEP